MVGELRHALSAVLFDNPLFLPEEQLLANHRIHEGEDTRQLAHWLTTTPLALVKCPRACSSLPLSLVGYVV